MLLKLTMEEELILKSLKDFVENEVKPRALEIDGGNEFPRDLWDRCAELGFVGICIPEEYGGLGMRNTMGQLVLEEIAKECPVLALVIDAHHLAYRNIDTFGTAAQKAKWLPKLAMGEVIGAGAGTEPTGAMPSLESQPMAVFTENGLLVNSTKIFCTNSGVADIFTVGGLIGSDFMFFIVEKDTPGLKCGGELIEHKMGMNGSDTGTVLFKDVLVPMENVLIPEDPEAVDRFRALECYVDISSISLGLAEGVFNKTLAYLKGRMRNGRPLATYQVVANHLARMKAEIEMMRAMVYTSADYYDNAVNNPIQVYATKAMVTEMAVEIAKKCVQLQGGIGYMRETGIERYLRDSVCNIIGETPTDLHLDQIAIQLELEIITSAPFTPFVGDLFA